MGYKSSLPLVAILDAYIIVSPSYIKLGEDFGVVQFINEVGDVGEGVGVMDSVFVDILIILAGSESSVPFLDEEERGGLRRIGGMNLSSFKVFF